MCLSTDPPHALFVEFGTVDTPSQPYLRPTVHSAMRRTFYGEFKRRLPR